MEYYSKPDGTKCVTENAAAAIRRDQVARIRANADELRRRVSPERFSNIAEWVQANLDDRQAIEEYTCQLLAGLDGEAQERDYNELRGG